MQIITIFKNFWHPLRVWDGRDFFYSLYPKFDDDPGYPVKCDTDAKFLLPYGYFLDTNNWRVPVILNRKDEQCFLFSGKKGPFLVDFDSDFPCIELKQITKWDERAFTDSEYQQMRRGRERVKISNSHLERLIRLQDAARASYVS